ncbi:hypothetical protein C8J57DRAFT_1250228 [Mycena rebaudengoi]|jgi:hypothetical protein|nr:hypothetical protein C8J57DRAFT_1250228 [Mycena rebaudengoi]
MMRETEQNLWDGKGTEGKVGNGNVCGKSGKRGESVRNEREEKEEKIERGGFGETTWGCGFERRFEVGGCGCGMVVGVAYEVELAGRGTAVKEEKRKESANMEIRDKIGMKTPRRRDEEGGGEGWNLKED